jgi:hypothetical protein
MVTQTHLWHGRWAFLRASSASKFPHHWGFLFAILAGDHFFGINDTAMTLRGLKATPFLMAALWIEHALFSDRVRDFKTLTVDNDR